MATSEVNQEGSSLRAKQLIRLIYGLAFWALIQALLTSKSFYRGAHWRSLSLEIFKILVLFLIVVINAAKRVNKDGASPNLMSLKISGLAMLMSALTDMAFMQMHY